LRLEGLEGVFVEDAVGNFKSYSTTELTQLGFPTTVMVIGQAEDVTPPMISVSATPKTLWPPNGRLVTVTVSGTITDAGSGVAPGTEIYEVSDEYGRVQPSGHITLDAKGNYTFTIQLQASRNGNDRDGRLYTITVSAQDKEGNMGSALARVIVPHDQGADDCLRLRQLARLRSEPPWRFLHELLHQCTKAQ
jgi:hypothetical protein